MTKGHRREEVTAAHFRDTEKKEQSSQDRDPSRERTSFLCSDHSLDTLNFMASHTHTLSQLSTAALS